MLATIVSSLDEIYCTILSNQNKFSNIFTIFPSVFFTPCVPLFFNQIMLDTTNFQVSDILILLSELGWFTTSEISVKKKKNNKHRRKDKEGSVCSENGTSYETRSLDLSRVRQHFQKNQADRQMNRLKHLKKPLN